MQPSPIEEKASWGFEQGDEIVPGRLALKKLGGGTDYEVYLAWDERLFSIVVAKILRPDKLEHDRSLRHLRREAGVLERLAHPVIVRSFEAVTEGPRPHLVLEHLEGPTLRSLLRRHGPLPLEQLLPLALNVCSALHFIAVERIVHLDVKPGNIVMGAPPRLIDLSIARSFEEAQKIKSPVGTDGYMAPEQCTPGVRGEIGPAADMWGLGVTLYEALTGRRPFSKGAGKSAIVLQERFPHLFEDPLPLPDRFPDPVAEPIMQLLSADPAARPTAADFALQLEPLVAALPRTPVLGRRRPRLR